MNKIYKVVWSKVKNCYIVVSEIAKNHSKNKSSRARQAAIAAIVGMGVAISTGIGVVHAADTDPATKGYVDAAVETERNDRITALNAIDDQVAINISNIAANTNSIAAINESLAESGAIGSLIKANTDAISSINASLTESGAIGSQIKANTDAISSINASLAESGAIGSQIKANADAISSINDSLAESGEVGGKIKANADAISSINASLAESGEVGSKIKANADAISSINASLAESGEVGGKIKANADAISSINASLTESGEVGSKIKANADAISSINASLAESGEVGGKIKANADAISSINASLSESGEVGSKIKANADAIAAEITRATGKENDLEAAIGAEVTRATAAEEAISNLIGNVEGGNYITSSEEGGTVGGNIKALDTKMGAMTSGHYIAADGTVAGNLTALDNKLYDVASNGHIFAADGGNSVSAKLGSTFKFNGDGNYITTSTIADGVKISMTPTPVFTSVSTGSTTNSVTMNSTGFHVGNVNLTSAGLNLGGAKLSGLGDGTAPSDAVTMKQFNENVYTFVGSGGTEVSTSTVVGPNGKTVTIHVNDKDTTYSAKDGIKQTGTVFSLNYNDQFFGLDGSKALTLAPVLNWDESGSGAGLKIDSTKREITGLDIRTLAKAEADVGKGYVATEDQLINLRDLGWSVQGETFEGSKNTEPVTVALGSTMKIVGDDNISTDVVRETVNGKTNAKVTLTVSKNPTFETITITPDPDEDPDGEPTRFVNTPHVIGLNNTTFWDADNTIAGILGTGDDRKGDRSNTYLYENTALDKFKGSDHAATEGQLYNVVSNMDKADRFVIGGQLADDYMLEIYQNNAQTVSINLEDLVTKVAHDFVVANPHIYADHDNDNNAGNWTITETFDDGRAPLTFTNTTLAGENSQKVDSHGDPIKSGIVAGNTYGGFGKDYKIMDTEGNYATISDIASATKLQVVNGIVQNHEGRLNTVERGFTVSASGNTGTVRPADSVFFTANTKFDDGAGNQKTVVNKNLSVSLNANREQPDDPGTATLDISLTDTPTFNSVVAGSGDSMVTIDANGLKFGSGQYINSEGINANDHVVKNVNIGTPSATSTNAATVGYVYDAVEAIKSGLTVNGVAVDLKGEGPEPINVSGSKNITITTAQAGNGAAVTVKLNESVKVDSEIQVGTGTRPIIIKDGDIKNLTYHAWDVYAQKPYEGYYETNVATEGQLKDVTKGLTEKGLNFVGDSGVEKQIHKDLGDVLNIKGGATGNLTKGNIGVNNVGGELLVQLQENVNLGNTGSVTTGNSVLNNSGLQVTSGSGNAANTTKYTGNGVAITQSADNVTAGLSNMSFSANSVDVGKNQIKNVASGIDGTIYPVTADNNGANIGDIKALTTDVVAGNENILVDTENVDGKKTVTVTLNDVVNMGSGAKQITIDGNKREITGLSNTTWNPSLTYNAGRAATEEQLKAVVTGTGTGAVGGWGLSDNAGAVVKQDIGKTLAVKGEAINGHNNITTKVNTNAQGLGVEISLNNKVVLGEGDKVVTMDGTTGQITAGTGDKRVLVDGTKNQIVTGDVNVDGTKGKAQVKVGDAIINGTTGKADITALSNTTWDQNATYNSGRAATEEQLQKAVGAVAKDYVKNVTKTGNNNLTFTQTINGVENVVSFANTNDQIKSGTYTASQGSVSLDKINVEGVTTTGAVTINGLATSDQLDAKTISYKANSGTAKTVVLSKGLNFVNGNNTTTEIGDDGVVKVNVSEQDINKAVNISGDSNVTADQDATTGAYQLGLSDNVTIGTGDTNINLNGTNGVATIGTVDGKKVTVDGAQGKILLGGVTVDGAGSVTGLKNNTYAVQANTYTAGRAATEDQLHVIVDKTAGGWGLTADDNGSVKQNLGQTLKVEGGTNINTAVLADTGVKINLDEDITLGTDKIIMKGSDGTAAIGNIKFNQDADKATNTQHASTIVGLTNTDWDQSATYNAGRAATEEQVQKAVGSVTAGGLDFVGDTGKVHRNLGTELNVIGGADTTKLTDDNIGVLAATDDDGNATLTIGLAKDIKVDSVNVGAGTTILSKDGSATIGKVGITATGAISNEKATVGADGTISNEKVTINNNGTISNEKTTLQNDGSATIGKVGITAAGAISNDKASIGADGTISNENVTIDNAGTATIGSGVKQVAIDGVNGIIETGTIKLDAAGIAAIGQNIKLDGAAGNGRIANIKFNQDTDQATNTQHASTIIGLSNTLWDQNGTYTAGRAATEEQLKAAIGQVTTGGLDFAGDTGSVHRNLGTKLDIVGGADTAKLTSANIGVVAETDEEGNATLTIGLAKDIKIDSVDVGNGTTKLNKDGSATIGKVGITAAGDISNDKVTIGNNGNITNDKVTIGNDGNITNDKVTIGNDGTISNDNITLNNDGSATIGKVEVSAAGAISNDKVTIGANGDITNDKVTIGNNGDISNDKVTISNNGDISNDKVTIGNDGTISNENITLNNDGSATIGKVEISAAGDISNDKVTIGANGDITNDKVTIGNDGTISNDNITLNNDGSATIGKVEISAAGDISNDKVTIGANGDISNDKVTISNDGTISNDNITLNNDGTATIGNVAINGNGDNATINGLTNKTWDPDNFVSGQGATEDQLKAVWDKAIQHTTVTGDEVNIHINPSTNPDGSENYEVVLDKDITVDSVTAANKVTVGENVELNSDGSATIGKVGISVDGAINNEKATIGADGTISNEKVTINNNGNITNEKVTIGNDGTISNDNITLNNDGSASLAGGNFQVAANGDIDSTYDGGTLKADGNGFAVTHGDSAMTVDNKGTTFENGAGNGSTNINGSTIAAGDITINGADKTVDAGNVKLDGTNGVISMTGADGAKADVTVAKGVNNLAGDETTRITYGDSQVATMADGLTFKDDAGNTVSKKLNETVAVTGDANITTVRNDNGIQVTLNKELVGLEKVEIGDVTIDKKTIKLGDTTIDGTSVTTNTVNSKEVKADKVTVNKEIKVGDKTTINGNTITTETVNATTFKAGDTTINNKGMTIKDGPSVTKEGIDAGNKVITNVAPGQHDTDAVNVSQLKATDAKISNLSNRVNKVGARAAALAALHPLDFDPDEKLTFAAGYGNYHGTSAGAIGAFYRPDEKTMFSVSGTVTGGESMINAGVSFALDRTPHQTNSKTAMAKQILDLNAKVALLSEQNAQMMDAMRNAQNRPFQNIKVEFNDLPEGHWAYNYVMELAKKGYLNGYPDGGYKGDRLLTRYEFATALYRAIINGAPVDANMGRGMDEFGKELENVAKAARFRVDRIAGQDDDRNKVERVRVNDKNNEAEKDYRDVYGSKISSPAK